MRKIIVLFLLSWTFLLVGQTTHQIQQLEKKRKDLLEQISLTNKLLKNSEKAEQSSLNKLALISSKIKTRQALVKTLGKQVRAFDAQIKEKEKRIKKLNKELKLKQKQYGRTIQTLSKRNNVEDKLLFILSAKSFAQTYRRVRYLRQYALFRKNQAEAIVDKRQKIEAEKKALEKSKREKSVLLNARLKEKSQLIAEEKLYRKELRLVQSKQKKMRGSLLEKQKTARRFNDQIERLIKEEIAARHKKKVVSRGKTGTTSKKVQKQKAYVMTAKEKQLSGSFVQNKGKLPMPLDRRGVIVEHFGVHKGKNYGVKIDNKGINIQTTPGAKARAVFDGVVSTIFVTPGYHSTVIVRHGNYITIYSNLSKLYVSKGDKVRINEAIGLISEDPFKHQTILHFQVRKETRKLDPELWLE